MKIYKKIDELVGNTPLFEPVNIEKEQNLVARLLLKLEYLNPAGSVKDRVALAMINDAENAGKIKSGATIIEPTSGNTGIGISAICASRGYQAIMVMPDTMSLERIKLLKAYGAKVVLTPGNLGMLGAIEKAEQLNREISNSIIAGQFENLSNPKSHYDSTGREIYEDCGGKIDVFVAGVGTGGTITGVGQYLKEKNRGIQIIAVEPKDSPLLTEGKAGAHKIQGIGANFIPKVLDTKLIDKVLTVSCQQAYIATRMLARTEGILVGISSGASLATAIELAKLEENKGKTIVALLPDTGDRYLSTDLFE